jgi:hypothetical protein
MDYITDSNHSIVILGALGALIMCRALYRRWASVVSNVPGPPSSSWLYGKSQVSISVRMMSCVPMQLLSKETFQSCFKAKSGRYVLPPSHRKAVIYIYTSKIEKVSVKWRDIYGEVVRVSAPVGVRSASSTYNARIANRCFSHSKNTSWYLIQRLFNTSIIRLDTSTRSTKRGLPSPS